MPRQFILPDLGEGIAEAQIIRVMVKAGDRIQADQSLMEVETDKAAVEIPSPFSGTATNVHVKEGQVVNVGDVIITFDDAAGSASGPPSAPRSEASFESPKVTVTAEATKPASGTKRGVVPGGGSPPRSLSPTELRGAPSGDVPATMDPESGRTSAAAAPAVRKLARELGVDLDRIPGSGPGGRVTREDVERWSTSVGGRPERPAQPPRGMAGRLSSAPPPGVADADKWGPVRRVPLTQIRKTIAAQMSRSAFTAVHVTHGDEADITELDRLRRALNDATGNDPKLTVLPFLIRALCLALRKHPIFNSSLNEEAGELVYKDYVHVGVAVDTERGLIVPVIRDADRLSLRGLAAALRGIADRVRTNQFAIEDLRGGTFTVTNVGALGGTFSTPIINFPEVAILGLGRTRTVPVLRGGQLAESMVLPLNLSFDHRVTDGANAARFTREIIGYLESPAKFMLD